jgi:hypothetical protein
MFRKLMNLQVRVMMSRKRKKFKQIKILVLLWKFPQKAGLIDLMRS